MPTRTLLLIAALLMSPLAGCRGSGDQRSDTGKFMTRVNSVQPGMAMETVRDELGKPDEQHAGTMPAVPPPGPMAAVAGRIPPGARYRHWVYNHGDSRFHVFFAQTIVQSGDKWEVVSVRSVPKAAVE
jgi:hypothetical protein